MRDVEICVYQDCNNVAERRDLCLKHYHDLHAPKKTIDDFVQIGVVPDLGPEELTELRRRVEADALPLFILALNWCATRAVVKAIEDADKRDRRRPA